MAHLIGETPPGPLNTQRYYPVAGGTLILGKLKGPRESPGASIKGA